MFNFCVRSKPNNLSLHTWQFRVVETFETVTSYLHIWIMVSTNTDKNEQLLDNETQPKENGTLQTLAGVAGNVLEWYE